MTRVETYPTLAEAARALGPDAAYLAGGTLLMREVNAGRAAPRIVRTTDPSLTQIHSSGDTVTLGAAVTMAQILDRPDLEVLHPVARRVGGPQVRNMATVAGNLFAPHPYGDLAVALLALGARVVTAGQGSDRPIEDVLRHRERAGLVAAIELPRPRDPRQFGFLKVSRVHPKGASVLAIAALLPREGGRIRGARVALGAMGPTPLLSAAIERVLDGQSLDAATIDRAAAVAAEGLDPPTDALASSWYRKTVLGVHLKRLLDRMGQG